MEERATALVVLRTAVVMMVVTRMVLAVTMGACTGQFDSDDHRQGITRSACAWLVATLMQSTAHRAYQSKPNIRMNAGWEAY